jgi:hypothetical protein
MIGSPGRWRRSLWYAAAAATVGALDWLLMLICFVPWTEVAGLKTRWAVLASAAFWGMVGFVAGAVGSTSGSAVTPGMSPD